MGIGPVRVLATIRSPESSKRTGHRRLSGTSPYLGYPDGERVRDSAHNHHPTRFGAHSKVHHMVSTTVSLQPWVLFFDGSRTETLAGAGIVLENPAGDRFTYSFQLEFKCTNNQAEYEALIIGLEVLLELGVRDVQIRGDSLLVINQLQEKYRCASCLLVPYLNRAIELLDQFDDVGLEYIHRERNFAANELAQLATGITLKYGVRERILKVERRTLPSWLARPDPPDDLVVAVLEPIAVDWRIPLINYLKQPDQTADRRTRFLALNYFLKEDKLRRRGEDGIDFRCVYGHEAK
ncbi:uncharacterized protein LOC112170864 [Rosa chinensis]|uniref:uncharacterized protein LOC112170864 n=1 Tax=Rosa chinensis TaxID=74649 RepID=UPI000D0922B3|nr:uncharacterized protein LOC112170864 [Rosa chinensis]